MARACLALQLGKQRLVLVLCGAPYGWASQAACSGTCCGAIVIAAGPTDQGRGDAPRSRLSGPVLAHMNTARDLLRLEFDGGCALCIESDAMPGTSFEGYGAPCACSAGEDLRRAVFLSPCAELWI